VFNQLVGKDIAVLKIEADPSVLFPIAVGTSLGIKVGQQAMAIGNPFGLDHTLTSGIISGTGREVRSPIGRPITNVLQTDAAINPGNSGGPLLDSSGRCIGMNTAIYSPSGASAGIGFAIPIDTVQSIVETLIRDGKVVRPVLGISYLGSKQARTLGINSGVLVLDVPPDSPAAKAGLKGTRRTESGLIGTWRETVYPRQVDIV
jgi:S1-C subfamily serine protease